MDSTRHVFGQVARNRPLRQVVGAYALFMVCEYGLWIAMLVYAYGEGGATAAGLVALAQLLPSAAVGVMAGPVAERTSPVRVLVAGYAVQAAAAAATTAVLFVGLPPSAPTPGRCSCRAPSQWSARPSRRSSRR